MENKTPIEETPSKFPKKKSLLKKKFKIPEFNAKKFCKWVLMGTFVSLVVWFAAQYFTYGIYRVMISNVSSRSATISWVTENPEPGMVVYREGSFLLPVRVTMYGADIAVDDRDYTIAELEAAVDTAENLAESSEITSDEIVSELSLSELGEYWTHHVTIRNLEPDTKYQFMVGNGNYFERVSSVNTEEPVFTTMSELEEIVTPDPAYGIVRYFYDQEYDDDVTYIRADDVIIYASLKDEVSEAESEQISSTMNGEGGWYLDVSSAYMENGNTFMEELGNAEATDINVYFTIEGVGFGRWTIVKNLEDCSPSDSFDLINPNDEDDSDLDFEEYIFVDSQFNSFQNRVINRAFAKPLDTVWEIVLEQNPDLTVDEAKSQASDATKVYVEVKKEQKAAGITSTGGSGSSSDSGGGGNADDWQPDEGVWVAPGITGYGGSDADAVGTCRGDVCDNKNEDPVVDGKVGTCGHVNSLDCRCVCSGETADISAGSDCTCEGGVVKEIKHDVTILSESASKQWQGGKYCDNNTGDTSKDCWSATNGCWYSTGHTAQNGLNCTSNGRWEDPENTIADNPVIVVDNDPKNYGDCWDAMGKITVDSDGTSKCVIDGNTFTNLDSVLNNTFGCYYSKKTGKTYWSNSPMGDDFGFDGSILSSERCARSENVNNYVSEIDVDSGYCDDNWWFGLGANVILQKGESYYECQADHTWDTTERDNIVCGGVDIKDGNECCFQGRFSYDISDGKKLKCVGFGELTWETTDSTKKVSGNVDIVDYDTLCDEAFEYCLLSTDVMIVIPSGTSKEKMDQYNEASQIGILGRSIAADSSATSYVVDTENGTVEGIEPGLYEYTNEDGDHYFVIDEGGYLSTNGIFSLYIDANNSGGLDENDILITDNAEIITLQPLIQGFVYDLSEGFNFVSFPFVFDNLAVSMASDLLEHLNGKYDNSFYSIAKFDSGRWKVVGDNGGNFDQNDFQIIPGEGYLLKSKWDLDITIYGKEVVRESVSDSAPIRFIPGWNLVGMYGTGTKSYTAQSLLEDVSNYQAIDFSAVNVSRWVEERSLYEGLQREADDEGMMQIYGLDFPITKKKGYFVKVTKGSGNWEPELD